MVQPVYNLLNDRRVAVCRDERIRSYPRVAPFNPSEPYPEYPFGSEQLSSEPNLVYGAIRTLLHVLGMDDENYGTADWNPLGEVITPGDTVVIKPNLVIDRHALGGTVDSIITHASVIRAVLDYAFLALRGSGRIVIADAPQADADFERLMAHTQLGAIRDLYRRHTGLDICVIDLRQLRFQYTDGILASGSRFALPGDPLDYTIFDLGSKSELDDLERLDRLYGADYDRRETMEHHRRGKHEYCIANSVLSADVVISIPKLKTHRKGGVTLNLKNAIGINGNKNYLPHFRIGTPDDGGDEYESLSSQQRMIWFSRRLLTDRLLVKPSRVKESAYRLARAVYRAIRPVLIGSKQPARVPGGGSWYGNDTIWRTILDINKILIYGNRDGRLLDVPQRRLFSVIDGIVGGEGDGPLTPDPKLCGLVVGGLNPVLVDVGAVRTMGFDLLKIPQYRNLCRLTTHRLTDVDMDSIDIRYYQIPDGTQSSRDSIVMHFEPPPGWKGHIELCQPCRSSSGHASSRPWCDFASQ